MEGLTQPQATASTYRNSFQSSLASSTISLVSNNSAELSSTSSATNIVVINVCGLTFETRRKTLKNFPNTLLGNDEKREKYYCPIKNEYFLNRHRESFASILFFYQSPGKLCRPKDVGLKIFIDECKFFELPEWAINFMKRKEGGFLHDDIFEILNNKHATAKTLRVRIWNFLEVPSSSIYALRFAYFYITLLFISIIINCLKTVKELRPQDADHSHDPWEITDIAINLYFLLEFVLRLVLSPSKRLFFTRVLVWIDCIALVTFIPLLNKHYSNSATILFFTPFQLFRVLRVFHVARMLPGLNLTAMVIKNSIDDLKIFTACLTFFVVFAGTIMFNIEHRQVGTEFTSIPNSMYWAIQTFVTLGYGDVVPFTAIGKLCACGFILCCIPALSIPVLSILVKFTNISEYFSTLAEDAEEGAE